MARGYEGVGSAVSTPHLSCVGFEAAHKAACLRNISSRRGPLHVGSIHTLHRDLLVNAGTLRPTEIGIWNMVHIHVCNGQ